MWEHPKTKSLRWKHAITTKISEGLPSMTDKGWEQQSANSNHIVHWWQNYFIKLLNTHAHYEFRKPGIPTNRPSLP